MRGMNADILAVLRGYPQIYYACHVDHTRARSNPHGLSARDASILAHLSRGEPLRASELARHLGVGPSTLSAALATLEALGYISREQDSSDRCVQRIRLAERGEIAMAESSVLDPARVESLFERLDDDERRRTIEGLGLLARAARELGGVVHEEGAPSWSLLKTAKPVFASSTATARSPIASNRPSGRACSSRALRIPTSVSVAAGASGSNRETQAAACASSRTAR